MAIFRGWYDTIPSYGHHGSGSIRRFLGENSKNVVVVHCKVAGQCGGSFSGGFRYGVQLLKKYLSKLIKTLTATFLKLR